MSADGAGAAGGAHGASRPGPPHGPGERARRPSCAARSRMIARRSIGSPILFTVVYSSLASAIYFSLGVIAGHALGLTPLVFLIAALLFALTAMTYVEGASLHQDRGGSTVFARYAFNELVSFIAGWAILLDYVILIAVTAFSATQYLRVFWSPLGNRDEALGLALAFIALVVLSNIRGFGRRRARRVGHARRRRPRAAGVHRGARARAVLQPAHAARPDPPRQRADMVGPDLRADDRRDRLHEPGVRLRAVGRGADQPPRPEAPGGEHAPPRWCSSTWASRWSRSRRCRCTTATRELATRYLNAPMLGIVEQVHPHWLEQGLMYLVGGARRADAGGRRELGDARALAAGLLAVDQPPDPQRAGPPAPGALHALRADHHRRA